LVNTNGLWGSQPLQQSFTLRHTYTPPRTVLSRQLVSYFRNLFDETFVQTVLPKGERSEQRVGITRECTFAAGPSMIVAHYSDAWLR
jgi:hypothetical protein